MNSENASFGGRFKWFCVHLNHKTRYCTEHPRQGHQKLGLRVKVGLRKLQRGLTDVSKHIYMIGYVLFFVE